MLHLLQLQNRNCLIHHLKFKSTACRIGVRGFHSRVFFLGTMELGPGLLKEFFCRRGLPRRRPLEMYQQKRKGSPLELICLEFPVVRIDRSRRLSIEDSNFVNASFI